MPWFANPLPPNQNPPRFHRRLLRLLRAAVSLGPIGLSELGGAEAAKRRMRPRPAVDRLDAAERIRRGLLARGAGESERPGLAIRFCPMGPFILQARFPETKRGPAVPAGPSIRGGA